MLRTCMLACVRGTGGCCNRYTCYRFFPMCMENSSMNWPTGLVYPLCTTSCALWSRLTPEEASHQSAPWSSLE